MKTQLDLKNFQEILAGPKENDTGDINKVLAILAQVSLAVLIIFVMIAILFATKYKDEAEYYKFRSEKLTGTTQSEALVDLQRQKLLLALEQTNHHYRLNLGHLIFYTTNEQNQQVVNTENIITGKQIRHDFIKACNFAQKELINFDKFKQHYTNIVISQAELAPTGVKVTPAVLDAQNRQWFENQVRGSTTALYEDTIRLQEDSKEGLATYYQAHLTEVKELQDLAVKVVVKKKPTRDDINTFIREVNIYVEKELQGQNVKFLKVAQKAEG